MTLKANARLTGDRVLNRAFVLTWLASFFHFGAFYILIPTLPLYLTTIGASETEIGLVFGAFSGTSLFLRPLIGREANRRSRKAIMVAGGLIFLVSTLLYPVTVTVSAMVVLRLFHGCGMAMFATGASTLIADLAPAHRRGEVAGLYGMAGNLAMAMAPAIGAFLVDIGGFTVLFLTAAGFAAAEVVLSALIAEPPIHARSTTMISRGAILPAAVFSVYQFAYGAVLTFVPLYAKDAGIRNPGLTFFTVYAVVVIAGRSITGRLADRYGRVAVTIPGLAVSALAMLVLPAIPSEIGLMLAATLYGFGFAGVQPTLMALTIDRVPPHERGSAMATLSVGYDVGIAIGSFVFATVLEATSFTTMFQLVALTPLVALALLVAGRRQEGRQQA